MNQVFDPAFESRKEATLAVVQQYQELSKLEPLQLRQVLDKKIKEVLVYTYNNLAWWRQRLGKDFRQSVDSKSFEAVLREIPVLRKMEQQTYSKWLKIWVEGSKPDDYLLSSTSGSTGQPVQVLKYLPEYHSRHFAVRLLDAIWQSRDLTKGTLALTQAKSNQQHPNAGEPFTFVGPTGPLRLANVSSLRPQEILRLISDTGASTVSMNGQLLKIIVDEQIKNPIHKIYIDQILTFADPIDQELRFSVSELFGAKICDRYSTEEFGFLAIQCVSENHLHALQFHNYIEILDDDGNPCDIGEIGRVVVTGLTNPAMPLIRYELGDLAKWGEPCTSGNKLPVLDPVITRVRDIVADKDGVKFIPTTGKAKFMGFSEVSDFQFYLFENGIAALIAVRSELSQSQLEQIREDVQKIFRTELPVQVHTTDSLSWLGHWKRRVFYKISSPMPSRLEISDFQEMSVVIQPR